MKPINTCVMHPRKDTWKLVTEYDVMMYVCGLRAGEQVRLRKALHIHDQGVPTGKVYPAGEVWTVLSGSKDDPRVVWFRQADGERHTWSDDRAEIDEWFERLGPAQ